MNTMLYMNLIEAILLGLSLILLFLLAFKNTKSISISILVSILLVPPLFLSIEGMSQFLLTDERLAIIDAINLQNSTMRPWYYGVNRTFDTVIGTLLSLYQKYTYVGKFETDLNELKILAKILHWFFGFLIMIAIYQLINKYYISKERKLHYFIIYFYSVLLLPLNIFALKMAYKNLYSMLFAVLAMILVLVAFKIKNEKYALIAIIIGVLAAQEKLIASPFLILAMISFIYMKLSNTKDSSYRKSLYYSFYSMFIVFLVSITSFLIVAMVVREGSIPDISFSAVMGILVGYLTPIIRVMRGGAFQNYSVIYALLLTLGLLSFVPWFLLKFRTLFTHFFQLIKNEMRLIVTVTIFLAVLTGIIGTYFIEIFLHPYYPIPEGNYVSPYSMNSFTTHFGATSFVEHVIFYIGAQYSLFVNIIPSVYLIIVFLMLALWNKSSNKKDIDLSIWRVILLLMFTVPFFYAMAHIPLENSYLNIFILLIILVLGLEFNQVLNYYNKITSSVLVTLFAIFLMVEVFPFRPIIGFFLPIWNQTNIEQYNNPAPGQTYIGWWSNGVEAFRVGKQIEDMVLAGKIANKGIINIYGGHDWIFTSSYAEWLSKPNFISIHYPAIQFKHRAYTQSDYYIITRRAIAEGYILPNGIEPFFTLSHRGFIQMWVYRGDQLKSYCRENTKQADFHKLKQGRRYSPCTDFF